MGEVIKFPKRPSPQRQGIIRTFVAHERHVFGLIKRALEMAGDWPEDCSGKHLKRQRKRRQSLTPAQERKLDNLKNYLDKQLAWMPAITQAPRIADHLLRLENLLIERVQRQSVQHA